MTGKNTNTNLFSICNTHPPPPPALTNVCFSSVPYYWKPPRSGTPTLLRNPQILIIIQYNRLALFSIHQKGSLDEYIRDFTQLSLHVLDLDEHSRALMFVRGLADNLRIDAMREHPRTFPEALRAARTAQRNSMMGTGSDHTRQRTPSVGQMPKRQFTARREKLSDEERTRLLREGRCFRCRGFGHVSRNCPENVPNASRQ